MDAQRHPEHHDRGAKRLHPKVLTVGRLDGTLDQTPVSIEADGQRILIRLPKMLGAARALLRLKDVAPSSGRGGLRLPREVDLPEVRVKAGRLPSFRVM